MKHQVMSSTFRIAAVASALILTTGCATQSFTDSGFIVEQPAAPVHESETLRIAVNRESLGKFDAVLIELPQNLMEKQDEKSAELVELLQAELATKLEPRFRVAEAAGPKTLRLRTALTDVNRSSRALNIFTTVLLFAPVDFGGATVEFELDDSMSGETVAAGVALGNGGLGQALASYSKYGHAKYAVAEIAGDIAGALVEPTDHVASASGPK